MGSGIPINEGIEAVVRETASADVEELEEMQTSALEMLGEGTSSQEARAISHILTIINARLYQKSVVVLER